MIPKITKQMYLNYISRREADLNTLKSSLRQNKADEFSRIGHQVLGNAATFGFTDLEEIAIKLESLNEDQLHTQGANLLREFSDWIESARLEFAVSTFERP